MNHFSNQCFFKKSSRKETKHIYESLSEDSEGDDEMVSKIVRTLAKGVKLIPADRRNILLHVNVENSRLLIDPDTGSDVDLINEKEMVCLLRENPALQRNIHPINTKITALGGAALDLVGCLKGVKLHNENSEAQSTLYILRDGVYEYPLLSEHTLMKLGMVEYNEKGEFAKKVLQMSKSEDPVDDYDDDEKKGSRYLEKCIEEYSCRFNGIGKLKDPNTDELILSHVTRKRDAEDSILPPRDLPFHLKDRVKKKIDYFVENGIMSWTKPGEPITNASPLVVSAKGDDDVRITADYRVVNKGVSRTRIVPGLRIDELQASFGGCKVFSKLDCNNGYHQLYVDEESKKYLTVTTPWGNLHNNTLPQGWRTSQDEFDRRVNEVLSGIQMVKANRDDILIGGRDWKEHNTTLREVLSRLKAYGLTLKRSKCEFGKYRIDFYGVTFSAAGISPSEEKVKALNNCGPPTTKEGVKSFLQMVGYMSRFIPQFSTISAPLRILTKREVKFVWETIHQDAFEKLKNALNTETNLAYFIPGREISIHIDAGKKSPNSELMIGGFCAILCQKNDEGEWRIVHIANRGITDVESRYGQTELESAAIRYAGRVFGKYLVGAPEFKIYTDCRPLVFLYNNPKSKAPLRIEKHILDLQGLEYIVVYKKGCYNIADFGSRHVSKNTLDDMVVRQVKHFENEVENHFLKKGNECEQEILVAAGNDESYQFLLSVIENDLWKTHRYDKRLKGYIGVADRLYTVRGIVYYTDLIVPPRKLQHKLVDVGHKLSHSGEGRTYLLMQDRIWFPGISTYCKELVKNCLSCQLANNITFDEPLESTPLPPTPWHTVAIDFKGPFKDGNYALVGYDLYSRYPVIEYCSSTKFSNVERILDGWFAAYGTPKKVKSDNGPPFQSHNFKVYAREKGFRHKRIKPKHPRGNGEVERFMRNINKAIHIAEIEGENYRSKLTKMLNGYRATPHAGTKCTPFELLFGRKMSLGILPDAKESEAHHKDIKRSDEEYKSKSKLYHDKRRHTKKSDLKVGDCIAMKDKRNDKFSLVLGHIDKIGGNAITVLLDNGKSFIRDKSHIKQIPNDRLFRFEKGTERQMKKKDVVCEMIDFIPPPDCEEVELDAESDDQENEEAEHDVVPAVESEEVEAGQEGPEDYVESEAENAEGEMGQEGPGGEANIDGRERCWGSQEGYPQDAEGIRETRSRKKNSRYFNDDFVN